MTARPQAASSPAAEERAYLAPQWKLVWWRFRRHVVALLGVGVLTPILFVSLFPEFLSIHDPHAVAGDRALLPPQRLHFFDEGRFRPYVYPQKGVRDPVSLRMKYHPDVSTKHRVRFFARGYEYKLFGVLKADIHLLGLDTEQTPMPFNPLGTDRLGRDMFSRLLHGIRISLSVGMVGMFMSLFLGVFIGGVSGYRGGWMDVFIQRLIEFIIAIPTLPLWITLSAAVPKNWSVIKVYFAITVIISLLGWTGMARVVRGRFLSLREEDFIVAARLDGAGQLRIIFTHMLPSFYSYVIAWTTLHIPQVILAETSLSFLGLGLRPPAISLGILLVEAQNLRSVVLSPWLLLPGLFVIIIILAFNFVGDGIRDAADPYGGG